MFVCFVFYLFNLVSRVYFSFLEFFQFLYVKGVEGFYFYLFRGIIKIVPAVGKPYPVKSASKVTYPVRKLNNVTVDTLVYSVVLKSLKIAFPTYFFLH